MTSQLVVMGINLKWEPQNGRYGVIHCPIYCLFCKDEVFKLNYLLKFGTNIGYGDWGRLTDYGYCFPWKEIDQNEIMDFCYIPKQDIIIVKENIKSSQRDVMVKTVDGDWFVDVSYKGKEQYLYSGYAKINESLLSKTPNYLGFV